MPSRVVVLVALLASSTEIARASSTSVSPGVDAWGLRGMGIVYGVIVTTAILQAAAYWASRDASIIPFMVAMAGRGALELLRDSGFHSGISTVELAIASAVTSIAEAAFIFIYLQLETTTRAIRITWLTAASLVALGELVPLVAPDLSVWAGGENGIVHILGGLVALVIAVLQLRAGFAPASYLLVMIAMNLTSSAYSAAIAHTGPLVPALDRWIFEIGTIVPALVFTLGIPFRTRFVLAERAALQRDLRAAEFAADHDPLTGLLNRRGLDAWRSTHALAAAGVLYIDLDGFKTVNDRGGHEAGDAALVAVADVLRTHVRPEDAVARVGGDEFVIVVEARGASRLPEIASVVEAEIGALEPSSVRIGASIGAALIEEADGFEAALAAADSRAYDIKLSRVGRAFDARRMPGNV